MLRSIQVVATGVGRKGGRDVEPLSLALSQQALLWGTVRHPWEHVAVELGAVRDTQSEAYGLQHEFHTNLPLGPDGSLEKAKGFQRSCLEWRFISRKSAVVGTPLSS